MNSLSISNQRQQKRQQRRERKAQEAIGISHGCLFAAGATFVTCILLFINGGLVSALCQEFGPAGPAWLNNPGILQFVMFVGPVILVVIQWMMIDYIVSRLRR